MLRTMLRPTRATLREALGAVEDLLDAVDVAGEAGDDQPLRRGAKMSSRARPTSTRRR